MNTPSDQHGSTPTERAIAVGGYFTLALIPTNILLSNMYIMDAATVSVLAGIAFTLVNLLIARQEIKKAYQHDHIED